MTQPDFQRILVTGATGFLGGELLRRILTFDRGCEVVLTLRESAGQSVSKRLDALLDSLFPNGEATQYRARVRAIEADLGAPGLGLSPGDHAALARSLTSIHHLAASVRFDLSLDEARRANVDTTQNVFALARAAALTAPAFHRLHHVSTYAAGGVLEEPARLDRVFRNSYEQSKAEAEDFLLRHAHQAPLAIFRTSIISGDSRTGWTPKFDTFYLAIRLFLGGLGAGNGPIPVSRSGRLDVVTVDYVADALHALARRDGLEGIYHLVAGKDATPIARALSDGIELLTRSLRRHRQPVPELPTFFEVDGLDEERFARSFGAGDSRELQDMLRQLMPYAFDGSTYDDRRARAALEGTGVRPRALHESLERIMDFCVRTDWGKRPERRPELGPALGVEPRRGPREEPVAIVGLGGVFPGAPDVPRFWESLLRDEHHISEVPRERWDREVFAEMLPTFRGGFVRELTFDAARFRIAPLTERTMDRLQKMVLIAATQALEDAPAPRDRARTGMILGYGGAQVENDYRLSCRLAWNVLEQKLRPLLGADSALLPSLAKAVVEDTPPMNEDTLAGSLPNVAVGRVMNFHDLKGPSYVVSAGDTSSLAAIEQAVDCLRAGECDLMLAGGASAQLDPVTWLGLSREGQLSAAGPRPFATDADGTVPGEGAAIFALKRLSDARRDGDRIHAVISGMGRAGAGRETTVTTPSSRALGDAIQGALESAGLSGAALGFVETHGSGIPEQDRAELRAVQQLGASCRLGAVKSRIGHLGGAAGAVAMMKAVLAVSKAALPPEAAFARPRIEWKEECRRAGVSTFGDWGQARHLILENDSPALDTLRSTTLGDSGAIAIISSAAVLPGAADSSALWNNLVSATPAAITEIPAALWEGHREAFFSTDEDAPDRSYGALGAFAPDVPVDSRALGIPPSTYARMDRSQRHFLAAAHRALAGVQLGAVASDRIGLVVGESKSSMHAAWELSLRVALTKLEYVLCLTLGSRPGWTEARRTRLLEQLRAAVLGGRLPVDEDSRHGSLFPVALARLAKALDARGGHVVIDAACASSLAAIRVALRELRAGRLDRVITGGVGVTVTPAYNVSFARCRALSATGSRPFDVSADGIVLGEGAVVFVLKRLDDAVRDGDRIEGVIRGVGASSDGRGHSMMAPDFAGQRLALERALADAGVSASSVQAVECHATGTPVGDEVEVRALAEVYGSAARDVPLNIGSVKAQIGHTIGAAGSAGLLKMLLGLRHGELAPTPLRDGAKPDLLLGERGLRLNTRVEPWPANTQGQPRRAGVSAFGFGGTNWHLILEEAPRTRVRARGARTAFLFPGHGSPYPNMGAELRERYPVFRATLDEANETLQPLLGRRIEELIHTRHGTSVAEVESHLRRTDIVQPVLTALNVAWYRLLREEGLRPDVVLGHSVGEFSAAVAAGVLPFDEALRAVHRRGAIFREHQLAGRDTGGMAAIFAREAKVREVLLKIGGVELWVANVNSPGQTVISGASNELGAALPIFEKLGIETRLLEISVAWHSPLAHRLGHEAALAAFQALAPAAPRVPLLSSVDGTCFEPGVRPDARFAEKLASQLGAPMNFTDLINGLHGEGVRVFIECGPRSTLTSFVSDILSARPHRALFCSHPKQSEAARLARVSVEAFDAIRTGGADVQPS